jgi:hypothetical protein
LQTVYIKVWERAGRFDAELASPITWLATIARNGAIDWRRSAAGRAGRDTLPEQAAYFVPDDRPLADEQMVTLQDNSRLDRCLGELEDRPDCVSAPRSLTDRPTPTWRSARVSAWDYEELDPARIAAPEGLSWRWMTI